MSMKLLYNSVFLKHDTGMHPENTKRLKAFGSLKETEIVNSEHLLKLIHTETYIKKVKEACLLSERLDPDTITSPGSYEAAQYAVGITVAASLTNDFALVRPPGHHAFPDRSSGFCIFNNIAIAVQKLVNEGKKVLIFDFDGHLGDGTEHYFYKSDKVLYWSLHQFPAFPGGGRVEDIGTGVGKGFTINNPLPPSTGDDMYREAILTFLPIALAFEPDVVAVSAGFDGHQHDLLLSLRLSLNMYYEIGRILKKNFKNIFASLEGGYNTEILDKCVYNFIDGINGATQRYKEDYTESPIIVIEECQALFQKLKQNLKPFWKELA